MDTNKKEEKEEVELVEEQGSEWFPDRSTTTATLFWICWRNKELPRQSCRQGSLQGIMRKGDRCSLSRILSTWEEKSGALYQEFSAHGSWEGKLGRVGVWEHGRVRPGSSAGVVGSRPAVVLREESRALSWILVQPGGGGLADQRVPKILCAPIWASSNPGPSKGSRCRTEESPQFNARAHP